MKRASGHAGVKTDLVEIGLHLHVLDSPLQEGHQGARWDLIGADVRSVHKCLIPEDEAGVTETCIAPRRVGDQHSRRCLYFYLKLCTSFSAWKSHEKGPKQVLYLIPAGSGTPGN
jgi:hypothetical protein